MALVRRTPFSLRAVKPLFKPAAAIALGHVGSKVINHVAYAAGRGVRTLATKGYNALTSRPSIAMVRRSRRGPSGRRRSSGRRTKRTRVVSAQSGRASTGGFKGGRMSKKAWRRSLYRATMHEAHYRSYKTDSGTFTTDSSPNNARFHRAAAIAQNFWTVGGGAQIIEEGGSVPTFVGDVTIRGGQSKIEFTNNSTVDCVKVKLWLVFTNRNPSFSILPTNGDPTGRDFDPSTIPEFERVGRVAMTKEFYLLPGNRPTEIAYRLRPRKVDQTIHNLGGEQPQWMYTLACNSNVDSTVDNVTVIDSHSLSFSADVGVSA